MPALPPVLPARRRRDPAEPGLRGLLAIIFWCACGITAVHLAGPFTLISQMGPHAAFSAIVDALSGDTVQTQVLRFGLMPQLVLFIWAVSFVVLAVMRRKVALSISPSIFAAWLVVTAFCQFAIRDAISPDGLSVEGLAALMPGLLAQGVGVAAFWAYMRGGEQPKAYFTR